jgi:hypothetical protein
MARPERRLCFVVMPFGQKADVDGRVVDFDRLYDEFVVPAVEAAGLECERCDRVDEAGNIHRRMFQFLWTADVALVDLSLLNANVFYELGIRHALRRSQTVLIRRSGTAVPFNVSNLTVIEYDDTDPGSLARARDRIVRAIERGYESGQVDSYVSEVLALSISDVPRPIAERRHYWYALADAPGKRLCIVTGDLRAIRDIDIWVNSENTNMQMARYYDFSVSSVIRYEGAEQTVTGHVRADTINDELQQLMAGERSVPPGHVLATSPGRLRERNGVRRVFHAAAVEGGIGQGYRVVDHVERCVTNALLLADSAELAGEDLRSILFPLFGIATRLASLRDTVASLFTAAVAYLTNNPGARIADVYFLAWSESELELCRSVLAADDGLVELARTGPDRA